MKRTSRRSKLDGSNVELFLWIPWRPDKTFYRYSSWVQWLKAKQAISKIIFFNNFKGLIFTEVENFQNCNFNHLKLSEIKVWRIYSKIFCPLEILLEIGKKYRVSPIKISNGYENFVYIFNCLLTKFPKNL